MKFHSSVAIALIAAMASSSTFAQSAADAQETLKGFVSTFKAKGLKQVVDDINGGTDPMKCRDKPGVGGFVATAEGKMLANCKNPKMVGQEFPPDFADVDGTPIVGQVIGPMKAGKAKWEANYKFAPAGQKKAVQQHVFCEKLDATNLACANYFVQ